MAAAKKQDAWNAMEEWDKIWLEQQDWLDEQEIAFQSRIDAVSYTHLTLPTIYSV